MKSMPHGWARRGPTRSMVAAPATGAEVHAKRAAPTSAAPMKGLGAIGLQLVEGRDDGADRGHGDRGVDPHAIDRDSLAIDFFHKLDIRGGFGL